MGLIRLMLAFGVLLAHMNQLALAPLGLIADFRLSMSLTGGVSVIFFYVVSGFLISFILDAKYPRGMKGTLAFYKSRFLRIYPLWVATFFFSALIVTQGADSTWSSRHGWLSHIRALVLVGQDARLIFSDYPELRWDIFPPGSEVSWTLGAELLFYLMAPFVLRSLKRSAGLFAVSAAIRAVALLMTLSDQSLSIVWTYFFFPSTLCFFLLGHFGRLISDRLKLSPLFGYSALAGFIAVSLGLANSDRVITFNSFGMYAGLLLFALAIPTVFATTKDNKIFNFLGDLTYPLYLVGDLCLMSVFAVWSGSIGLTTPRVLALAATIQDSYGHALALTGILTLYALSVAIIVHYAVERPLIRIFRWLLDRASRFRTVRLDLGLGRYLPAKPPLPEAWQRAAAIAPARDSSAAAGCRIRLPAELAPSAADRRRIRTPR
jgi:peptidoglycan/LPS O-acetylase OafA/YrhL